MKQNGTQSGASVSWCMEIRSLAENNGVIVEGGMGATSSLSWMSNDRLRRSGIGGHANQLGEISVWSNDMQQQN